MRKSAQESVLRWEIPLLDGDGALYNCRMSGKRILNHFQIVKPSQSLFLSAETVVGCTGIIFLTGLLLFPINGNCPGVGGGDQTDPFVNVCNRFLGQVEFSFSGLQDFDNLRRGDFAFFHPFKKVFWEAGKYHF